jgi:hypothetical protein
VDKSNPLILHYFSIFQKTTQRKQSPNLVTLMASVNHCQFSLARFRTKGGRDPFLGPFLSNEFANCASETVKARSFLVAKNIVFIFETA